MRQQRPGADRLAQSTGLSRRSLLSAGLFGTAAATLAACSAHIIGATAPPEGDDIVIATDLELSGNNLVVGKAQWNAIKIIAGNINANGFVAGGRTRKITLLSPFDNLSDPKQAVIGMNRLIDNPNVSAIIGAGSAGSSVKMAAVAEQRQVPMISLASASAITAPISSHAYVFRLGPNATDVARMLATAIKNTGHRRIALMYAPDAHGADGKTQMALALSRNNLTQVAAVAVPAGAASAGRPIATASPSPSDGPDPSPSFQLPEASAKSDMAAQVAEVMAASPDAVAVWAVSPMSGLVARSLRNAGYRGQLFFDSGAGSSETLSPQNLNAVEGSVLVAPSILGGAPIAVTTPAAQALVDFYNSYTATYTTFDGLAPYGGDALKLIIAAVVLSGDTDRQSLRESIEQTNSYEGLAGSYTFGPNYHGGVAADSLALFHITHGGWVDAS